MKRSGFKQKSYEERLKQVQDSQARQRAKAAAKTRLRAVLSKVTRQKSSSEAAKAGKRRSKQKKAENDKLATEFKKQCRERDNYTCQWPDCKYRDHWIQVHHINERSQRPDLKYDIANGVCICSPHHDRMHHTVAGRARGRELGLLGGETYERSKKERK